MFDYSRWIPLKISYEIFSRSPSHKIHYLAFLCLSLILLLCLPSTLKKKYTYEVKFSECIC